MPNYLTHVATVARTRQLEAEAVARGASWAELMERAGRGVADEIIRRSGLSSDAGARARETRVLVLVGPGNNGGDGLVVARHLHDAGMRVALYIWKRAERADDQPWRECRVRGIPEMHANQAATQQTLRNAAQRADLVVDALLGIGVDRPLEPALAAIVGIINSVRAARETEGRATPQVVAIDVPTGIDADTGAVLGDALAADLTVATGVLKPGHQREPGRQIAGEIVCVPIGLSFTHEETAMAESLNAQALRALLPDRPADSHKGTYGKVMIVAGSGRYPGAAVLSTSGALRSGVGLATLACGRSIFGALAASLHETTFLPLPEADWGVLGLDAAKEVLSNLADYGALVIGPGLGQEDDTKKFLERLLKIETPATASGVGFLRTAAAPAGDAQKPSGASMGFLRTAPAKPAESKPEAKSQESGDAALPLAVIDADGLNLLAQIDEWWSKMPAERLVLTPHPGEMARLLKLSDAAEVNGDRVGAALRAAQEWQQIVVLKGAETVIAAPDGKASIGPAGNPALATAGTGDVLAGVIGGLLAQGLSPFDAARLGVYLHAQAGQLVRREIGEAGALAGDLLLRLPRALGELKG